ncbi:hypothetical protein BREU_3925 [Bifidobacterium reuteri DSM 23975]|uniref:Uncharacterized protein n=1 Tax=Bifidobacterium reuteri DSM 23975 TaxID=1437610 RepID=A0A087CPA4_9BIFI|nr:hypothetical protein BREU_3925 [Bifidobacterium reuteri DSM 23975]
MFVVVYFESFLQRSGRIIVKTHNRYFILIAALLMILGFVQPVYADSPNIGVSPNPPVQELGTRGVYPPHQIFGPVKDINNGSYSFAGSLPGTVYTEYRFKGKRTYMVHMSQITQPLEITVYKYNSFNNATQIARYNLSASGASFSFGTSSTNDEIYLSFASYYNCDFSGYVY